MNFRVSLFSIAFLFLAFGLSAAEPKEINLDDVVTQFATNEEALNVFFSNLSAKDLAHWSEASRLYRKLFKDELIKRRDLVKWSALDLRKAIIECCDCTYQTVVFSSDGKKIAGCGHAAQGSVIQIFDTKTLSVERMFAVQGMVESLCFSPDNRTLAASNGIGEIVLFDVSTGAKLFTVVGLHMFFMHDGMLMTVTHEGNLCTWDTKTGKKIRSIALERGDLIKKHYMSLIFSPDGQKIVGGSDHSFIIWSCGTGKRIKEFPGMTISGLAFSSDGKVLACKNTFFIKLLDPKTGKDLKIIHGDFLSMAFFPDNRVLVTAKRMKSGKISIQLWHILTGQLVNDLSDNNLVGSVVLSVSSEGKILVASSWKHVVLWYRD